ncbi:MAG: hypothetical protein Q8N94_03725 [Methanoregula sp.]|nr:hypothetical protein [Methanoregula sp.]
MPAYYFAMEGYHTGEKPDPAEDKLITIQYQKIDLTTGEPLGEVTILKEWESSEKSIITAFYNEFFKPEMPVTHFIPVGMNLDYEYEMMIAKFKKYNLRAITSYQLYYQRPRFELRPIVVLLNDGRFTGARLDLFSSKKYDASHMRKWYEKQDFKKIEHFIREETEAVLKLLQYLSKYKTRLGITKKTEPGQKKPAERPLPPHREKALLARVKSPAKAMQATKRPAGATPPASYKSSAGIAKAELRSSKKSPAGPKSAARRSSVPLNQFRKHTPTKKNTGKRG